MALFALIATPFYIRIFGTEAYGLIALFTTLSAFISIVDLGLGEAFCRESARLALYKKSIGLRTLEILYWCMGGAFCLFFLLACPRFCEIWLYRQMTFSPEKLCYLLRLMGIALFFFWPTLLYTKGLQGHQAHFTNNFLLFSNSALRYLGGMVFLHFYPTLEAFFYWHIGISVCYTLCSFFSMWNKLSISPWKFQFSLKALKDVWKFSLGMSLIAITGIILTQADKFFVSHFFSFDQLAYYSLAYTVASSLYYFIFPTGAYYYPRFIAHAEKKDYLSLELDYYKALRHVFSICLPLVLIYFFFGKQMVALWTGNTTLAEHCAPLIKVMVVGICLNCFMSMTFYLFFALKQTAPLIYHHLIALVVLIPLFFQITPKLGLMAAPFLNVLLNVSYLILIRFRKKLCPV